MTYKIKYHVNMDLDFRVENLGIDKRQDELFADVFETLLRAMVA